MRITISVAFSTVNHVPMGHPETMKSVAAFVSLRLCVSAVNSLFETRPSKKCRKRVANRKGKFYMEHSFFVNKRRKHEDHLPIM